MSQFENGQARPRPEIVAALADYLGIPRDLWPGLAVPDRSGAADPRRDPIFFEFAARIAGHKWLRRAVVALADDEERVEFEEALRRAEELQG